MSYNGNCQLSQGNSGGAAWTNDNQVYGVVSRSRTSFDANEFGENETWYSASSNWMAALKEMQKTSPAQDVLGDIISGRKVWNNGSVSDAVKIDKIDVPASMPDNRVQSVNPTGVIDADGSRENLLPVASFVDASGAPDVAVADDTGERLEKEKQQIDNLGNQVIDAIGTVTAYTTDAEIFDILDNLVQYDTQLENWRQAKKAYDEAKAREQSLANRMLGAAAIGAGGIGGMQLASALAEQRADADAERDMTAYLATFRCDYGAGRNISGGEVNVQLPGANVLLPLYNEYTTLAADLKTRKEALGMAPGIESEVILDAATSGLYDNAATGITEGTYTSISRALMNPNGADAAEWATQTEQTAQQVKTGGTVAGAGLGIGLVGNIAENVVHNAQSNKNESQK